MNSGVLGFDLSPSLCGWAFIDEGVIEAGAFGLPQAGADLGTLLAVLEQHFMLLLDRFKPARIGYEAPILLRHDALMTLRRIYGLGMGLEYFSLREGLECNEVDLQRVKAVMTGEAKAPKPLVVKAAQRLGVLLPHTDALGRKDAADAVGVALEIMRLLHPEIAAPLLAKLNGTLL